MQSQQDQGFKKHRQTITHQIRKAERQQKFSFKRNKTDDNCTVEIQNNHDHEKSEIQTTSKLLVIDEQRRQLIQGLIRIKYFPHQFNDLARMLYDQDVAQKHKAIIGIRKVLSVTESPPVYLAIQNNILPVLIQYMQQTIYPQLRLQATWIVSNIASGGPQQVTALIQSKVHRILIELLLENQHGVADQAIWAIGNLAGDSPKIRDELIQLEGVDAVVHLINNTKCKKTLVQGAWALSNLCRGHPLPDYEKIEKAIPILCKIVKLKVLDEQNLADCLWAISYGTEGPKTRLSYLIESEALKQIIECTKSSLMSIASPALRIIGSVSTGNQSQTQLLLKQNILTLFQSLLQNKKSLVRRQVCWILSNIAAGTRHQVDQILNNQIILDKVLTLFQVDSHEVKRQICFIFANMVFLGDKNKIKQLIVGKEIMRYYADCINQRISLKLVESCLEVLPMLFEFGERMRSISPEDTNFVIYTFLNYPGVIKSFEELQKIQSPKIYNKTIEICQRYFQADTQQNNGMEHQI